MPVNRIIDPATGKPYVSPNNGVANIRPGDRRDADGQSIYGEDGFLLPHFRTFSSIFNFISRVYKFTWDEALRAAPQNALAMRRDVSIMEMVRERQIPTTQMAWELKSHEDLDERQQGIADDLTRRILRTPRFQQLKLCLLEALWYGRYGTHHYMDWVPGYDDKKELRILDWYPINGDKIQFRYDPWGVPALAINMAEAAHYPREWIVYGDRYPMLLLHSPVLRDRFIIHRHEIDDADYFEPDLAGGSQGVGIRHRIYWGWWIRDEMWAWALDYLERIGAGGLTVFYYDSGNPQAQIEAEYAAKNYSRRTALAWPATPGTVSHSGSRIERVEATGAGAELLRGIIDYFDDAMRKFVVGQSLETATASTGIGGDAAKLRSDMKYRNLKFDATNLGETLTKDLVRPMLTYGYPDEKIDFDLYWCFSVDAPDAGERLQAAKTVYGMGVPLVADEVRDIIGMSKPGDDDDIIQAPPDLSTLTDSDRTLFDDLKAPDKPKQEKPSANPE